MFYYINKLFILCSRIIKTNVNFLPNLFVPPKTHRMKLNEQKNCKFFCKCNVCLIN